MLENLHLAILRRKNSIGLHQGKVAVKAGILESRLSRIINGYIKAKPEERAALSRVLGISEEILFVESKQEALTADK